MQRDAYRIEKLFFESRPEFLVTANLYVPKGREFPLPGVVGTQFDSFPSGARGPRYTSTVPSAFTCSPFPSESTPTLG